MKYHDCYNCAIFQSPCPKAKQCMTGGKVPVSDGYAPSLWVRKAEHFKPGRTNADRIRAMNDEELAKWLTGFAAEAFAAGVMKFKEALMSEKECLDWLRQEVKE